MVGARGKAAVGVVGGGGAAAVVSQTPAAESAGDVLPGSGSPSDGSGGSGGGSSGGGTSGGSSDAGSGDAVNGLSETGVIDQMLNFVATNPEFLVGAVLVLLVVAYSVFNADE